MSNPTILNNNTFLSIQYKDVWVENQFEFLIEGIKANYFPLDSELFDDENITYFMTNIIKLWLDDYYAERYIRYYDPTNLKDPTDIFKRYFLRTFITHYPTLFIRMQAFIKNELHLLQQKESRGVQTENKQTKVSAMESSAARTTTPNTQAGDTIEINDSDNIDAKSASTAGTNDSLTGLLSDINIQRDLETLVKAKFPYPLASFIEQFENLFVKNYSFGVKYNQGWGGSYNV